MRVVTAMISSMPKHPGSFDPMLRTPREVALEPRRVVVELNADEFEALNRASGRDSPADYLRAIALRELGDALSG
jgi:hypothetical protein